MPASDESEVRVELELELGSRLDVVHDAYKKVEETIRESVPEALCIAGSVGGSGFRAGGGHTAEFRIPLVERGKRKRSSEEVASSLRGKLKKIPGVKIRTRPGQGLFFMRLGNENQGKILVEVRGYDFDVGDELARLVSEKMKEVEGIEEIKVSRETGVPEEMINIDRSKAYDMKLSVSKIANALQTAITGTGAGYFREGGNEYKIVVKVKDADRMRIGDILDLKISNGEGDPVVLKNVVTTTPRYGSVKIDRKNQERIISVSGELAGRDLGAVTAELKQKLDSIPLRKDFSVIIGGDYDEQKKAFAELMVGLALALCLVYMVMACQYESLKDPLIVMFSVPFAATGVILTLFLSRTTFNIQSYIGCIILGGIVVNNAIILVDHINLLRRRDGMPLAESVKEAGKRRLRPILMTTLTTVIGLFPLALGLGDGGDAQAPMARALIGGLTSSTLITLVLIPVVYYIFENRGSNADDV